MNAKPVRMVLSVWSWFVLGLSVVIWLPLVAIVRVVTMPFDKGAYAAGFLFRKVVMPNSWLNPLWKFTTSGEAPDDMRKPYVVVANHESFVDMLLLSHLPWEMKYLSKIEIMKIPFLGQLMRLARDIPLVRGDAKSGIAALNIAKERLGKNTSVLIFPEGSRSKTGELREFSAGAFKIAIEGGYPILPLAIHGTRDCLNKGSWIQGRAHAEVRVLDPVPTEGLTKRDLDALRTQVRDTIVDAREQLRAEHGDVAPPSAPLDDGVDGVAS